MREHKRAPRPRGPAAPEEAAARVPASARAAYAKKLPPGSLLALQGSTGNAALARLLAPQAAIAVQRAIGLEIEIPIPVDDLAPADVANIRNDAKKNNFLPYQHVKKVGHKSPIFDAANGFKVETDHDNRVRTGAPNVPPVEGGDDSIMEIVFDPPAINAKEFKKTMDHIDTFITDVETNTAGMTTRWVDPGGKGVSIGPLDYPPLINTRKAKHNWKGSVQVNIGVDPREYHSLMNWYAKSKYAKSRRARETAPGQEDTVQALFEEARKHIAKSVDVGRNVTAQLKAGIGGAAKLTAQDLVDAGNLRGLRGWLTHIAFYLLRGTAAGAGGTPKNVAPVLLKTPPEVINDYALTAKEQKIFAVSEQPIVDFILNAVGRGADVGTASNALSVFPNTPTMLGWTLDTIIDLQGKNVPLTAGPLGVSGVGPAYTGKKVSALKQTAPGDIGGVGRGGVVAEYRMIPGYFEGAAAWRELGLEFLKQANKRNRRSGTST